MLIMMVINPGRERAWKFNNSYSFCNSYLCGEIMTTDALPAEVGESNRLIVPPLPSCGTKSWFRDEKHFLYSQKNAKSERNIYYEF